MQKLREAIQEARAQRRAIGHFNVSDSNQFNAIVAAARNLGVPAIVGASEGERAFFGVRALAALVREAREGGAQIYLNADHTYSLEKVKEAVDAGFDAAIFDGSHLSVEENISQTRAAVALARESGRDTLVEGELGRIGTSSKLLDAPPEDMDAELTAPEGAARFVSETGVDLLAPAVGTMHGRLKSGPPPRIDAARVAAIAAASPAPLVLHGGSGSTDEDLRAAIAAGVAIVHINTDIRVAYRRGIEQGLAASADEIAPYKYLGPAVEGMRAAAEQYLRLFTELP